MTLHVEERFQAFEVQDAYAASVVLALLAVMTLLGDDPAPKGRGD